MAAILPGYKKKPDAIGGYVRAWVTVTATVHTASAPSAAAAATDCPLNGAYNSHRWTHCYYKNANKAVHFDFHLSPQQ